MSKSAVPTAEPNSSDQAVGPDADDKYEVVVRSPLHERVTHVQKSVIDLVTTAGTINGSSVLVPILDWHLLETKSQDPDNEEENSAAATSRLFYFENIAFLMQSVSQDLRQAVYMLAGQTRGGVAPLEDRMEYTADLFKGASELLADAAEVIKKEILPNAAKPSAPADGSSGRV